MAPKSNRTMQRSVSERDKLHSTLTFNQEFPTVEERLIDQKNDQRLKQQELRSKKRLLPLEIAALPEAERNEVLRERELAAFKEKQVLPRRAVKQASLRKAKKEGEQAAQAYQAAELKKLDDEAAAKQAELERKYPSGGSTVAPADAVAAYNQALKEETAKMQVLQQQLSEKKRKRLKAITTKLTRQNTKLQARFDTLSKQLRANSEQYEQDFGKDDILSVRDLKMYFSGIKAVDGLSFNIKQGEIFGLIGPNGAGKTTVFNCITQFYKPTGGEVYYRDRYDDVVPLIAYKPTDIIKAGIARTFQNLELVYWLSILDNMLIGVHAFYRSTLADQFVHSSRLRQEEDVFRHRAIEILERLGIAQYKDMPPMGLPYGVLKKVELARTLMSNPRMIILDEPAAGLNDAETEELTEIIRLIRDDFHCTIFLVEHDMNLVMNVCDTVCAISFGKMLAIGTPEEIQNSPAVQEAYLGTE